MKRLMILSGVGCWLAATICSAQVRSYGGGAGEQHTTIVIKADGSSIVTNASVQSRTSIEEAVRMWEVWKKRAEGAGDDAEEGTSDDTTKETKPYTDDELIEKIRETDVTASEMVGTPPQKIESIEIRTNIVRMVKTGAFSSLHDLAQSSFSLGDSLPMENVRFEVTNAQLRLTFTPSSGMQRYSANLRQQWKKSGATLEVRLILPGKIISSGLPNTQDNVTWIRVDSEKPESVETLLKLYATSTIILGESAGLKLEAPLDSKKLQRAARRPGAGADENIPITDAGPGFLTEGVSVTTSTVYHFPEGAKLIKHPWQFGMNPAGTTVQAKLFGPKDRTIKSASGVRVLKAVDDKGREIRLADDSPEEGMSETYESRSSGRNDSASLMLTLRLALPAANASSISELAGEAIAFTVGRWKDFSVTNVQAGATNEIDLGSILPGATITLTKVTLRDQQVQLQAKLKGPKEIRQLELQLQKPGNQEFNSHANDLNFATKDGQSTRNVSLQGYSFQEDGGSDGPVVLLLRSPLDVRRERVRFTLKDLDLF